MNERSAWLLSTKGRKEITHFLADIDRKRNNNTLGCRLGEIERTIEEFMEEWTKKGVWKDHITVMKYKKPNFLPKSRTSSMPQ
ncbi:MAG: hypothetical protein H0Z19_11315 [Archaeoglobus sp.]|uniref:hypothetical protein n=1 Tax=Archaeoglobus sp. TaxID=1872626 RepID=UPI001DF7BEBC|nr:hypothetical protein [Archaeoglobus sp.]MBO8181036.1 hypothetical protein [Archaeoglobus sp.]